MIDFLYDDLDEVEERLAAQQGAKRRQARGPSSRWLRKCTTDRQGRPLPNLANVMIALRNDPAVKDAFAYDEMLCAVMLLHSIVNEGSTFTSRPVTDVDVSSLQEWLQLAGLPNIDRETTHQAVDLRARECAFHLVRDYLDGLRWDGTPRINGWLATYLGAERSPYTDGIGRMFLISMVARIFKPGWPTRHNEVHRVWDTRRRIFFRQLAGCCSG